MSRKLKQRLRELDRIIEEEFKIRRSYDNILQSNVERIVDNTISLHGIKNNDYKKISGIYLYSHVYYKNFIVWNTYDILSKKKRTYKAFHDGTAEFIVPELDRNGVQAFYNAMFPYRCKEYDLASEVKKHFKKHKTIRLLK